MTHRIQKPAFMARSMAMLMVSGAFFYILSKVLVFWFDWPAPSAWLAHLNLSETSDRLEGLVLIQAALQWLLIPGACLFSLSVAMRRNGLALQADAQAFHALSAYLVRAAFWVVLLVGAADIVVSFLRIENLLASLIGADLTQAWGRPTDRVMQLHLPLIILAFIIAAFRRDLGFIWLALLVVLAEFQIVIARFIFSYEQAFMGDLVRFWYAALFIFASAYTLAKEGHVRVDVFYAGFSEAQKAWCNTMGCLLLGFPICWVILSAGFGSKTSVIASPLLSFEISQSGYGLYVKYLMAGFLLVFAVSMLLQFATLFLRSVAVLTGESRGDQPDIMANH